MHCRTLRPWPHATILTTSLGTPLVAVLMLCGGTLPARAAPTCPIADQPVSVTLTADTGKVTWRTRSNRRNLERLARSLKTTRIGGHPTGLTVAEFKLNMRTSVKVYPLPGNRYCAVPSAINFAIGYPDFVIYIDRRYRHGTCEYQQIRDHEEQHVAVYRDQLHRFTPELRAELERAAQRFAPIFLRQQNQAAEVVQATLKRQIDPLLQQLQQATDAINSRLDTKSSYMRIQKRCRNW